MSQRQVSQLFCLDSIYITTVILGRLGTAGLDTNLSADEESNNECDDDLRQTEDTEGRSSTTTVSLVKIMN